ncbi:MAG: hypothetical protein GY814_02000 [Gammaproteobacteria bacterium]|nr:hypothetical protein [Gammaproteobacteria bacterium]
MKKILSFVFLGIFMASMASISMFNHFYAKRAMERDTEQLLYEFHDALTSAHNILANLPDPENIQCSKETVSRLVMHTFEHPSIRLLGVLHGKDQICSSSEIQEDISSYKPHRLSSDYTLATATHGDRHKDLLLIREHNGSRYFANIDPFLVNHLTEKACSDCLSYQISIEGDPAIFFLAKS